MSTVLVTGAAGFIGSGLVEELSQDGYKVLGLDSITKQVHGENPEKTSFTYQRAKAHCEFVKGDVRDRSLVQKLVDRADYVIHLAAETGTGQSMYAIADYCDVNITGTAIVMEAIAKRETKLQGVLVASSRAIYGEGKYECQAHGIQYPGSRAESDMTQKKFDPLCPVCSKPLKVLPTSEDTPGKPQSIYGITKLAQEDLILKSAASFGIPATALRLQNVYGPGQSLSNPYTGILSIFSSRARANKPISIFEDGFESRDFVFVDEVRASFRAALKAIKSGQWTINVGSGTPTTVSQVVEEIINFFNAKSDVSITGQFRIGDIRHNVADLTLAKEKLGFQSKIDFKTGIRKFLEWVEAQEAGQDLYEKSLSELRERGLLK